MKKSLMLLICLLAVVLLSACEGENDLSIQESIPTTTLETISKALTWEEQYDLGMKYFLELDYEQAIVCFNLAIEIEPRRFESQYAIGCVYRAANTPELAIDHLTIAIEVEENTFTASYELGYVYLDLSMLQEAEELAIPLWQSGDVDAGVILVLSYAAQERFEEMQILLEDEILLSRFNEFARSNEVIYFGPRNEKGEKEGYGIGIYGSYIYTGSYIADVRSGQGIWRSYYTDTWYFTGEWSGDAPNGYGHYYWDNLNVREEGNYTEGLENGLMGVTGPEDAMCDLTHNYTSTMGIRTIVEYHEDSDGGIYAPCNHQDSYSGWGLNSDQYDVLFGVPGWSDWN